MGAHYSAFINVGYVIEEDELFNLLECRETPGEYRYEDRYDPKTGEKAEPAKFTVREPECEYYFEGNKITTQGWGGECEWSAQDALIEIVKRRTGADIERNFEHNGLLITVNSNKLVVWGETEDYGRVTLGPSLTYNSVLQVKPELEKIKRAFENLNIDLGEPLIIHNTCVG